MLLTKTPDKDWFLYQKTCLQLLEYLKSRENFIDLIIRHFCTPVIPDLIMQMLRELKGAPLKKNLYEVSIFCLFLKIVLNKPLPIHSGLLKTNLLNA